MDVPKIRDANRLAETTVRLCHRATLLGIFWSIEDPRSSCQLAVALPRDQDAQRGWLGDRSRLRPVPVRRAARARVRPVSEEDAAPDEHGGAPSA